MAYRSKREIMAGVDCIESKIINRNTVEYYKKDGTRVIRLHLTDVLTVLPDGTEILNSGGWMTPTTKDRINATAYRQVCQKDSMWLVNYRGNQYVFADGITFHPNGKVTGAGENPKLILKLQKQIKKYADDFVKELVARKIPAPSNGDCLICIAHTSDGEPVRCQTHIRSHISSRERYYVPSLLANALEEFNANQMERGCVGYWFRAHEDRIQYIEDMTAKRVKRYITQYIKRQLGMAV